jgi:hypothetical protein
VDHVTVLEAKWVYLEIAEVNAAMRNQCPYRTMAAGRGWTVMDRRGATTTTRGREGAVTNAKQVTIEHL